MIQLFILYVVIIVSSILYNYFGNSLENVQYYHHRLTGWGDKTFYLDCCVLSSILYSQNKYSILERYLHPSFSRIFKLENLTFSRKATVVGCAICTKQRELIFVFRSTSNLSDVQFSVDNSLISTSEGYIHRGYNTIAEESLPSVMYVLSQFPDTKNIVICGHSLGGAIGSIVGYKLASKFEFYNIKVKSFGAPKYGDKFLKHNIENFKNLDIINYINLSDQVIYKPACEKFKRIGRDICANIDTGNDNVNHGIKVYREILNGTNTIKYREYRFDEILSKIFLDILG